MPSLKEWVATLGPRPIPVLRQTVEDLGALRARGEAISGRDVAQVVLRDPLMTLNLLRFSQARLRRREVTEITTVEHAIMMHGLEAFFRQFRDLPVAEDELAHQPEALRGLRRALSHAWFAGVCARVISGLRNDMEVEEVMISALLHDFTRLLLWCAAPGPSLQLEQMPRLQRAASRATCEELVLGFPEQALHQALVTHWNLPHLLHHHGLPGQVPHPRLDTVRLSVALVRHAEQGWHHSALPEEYQALARLIGLPADQCVRWVHQAAVQAARSWRLFGVAPAAAYLPMLPGPWPPEPASASARHADAAALVSAQLAVARPASPEQRAALVAALFYALSSGLGLRRLWFGRLKPGSKRVEATSVLLMDGGLLPGELAFEVGSQHLFARLLPKPQSLWFTGSSRQRLATLLPEPLRQKLEPREFLAMSLHVGGAPFGLLYADCGTQPAVLDEARYADFKRLCVAFSGALERVAS